MQTDGISTVFQHLSQAAPAEQDPPAPATSAADDRAQSTESPRDDERDRLRSQLAAAHEALRAWTELEVSLQADMRRTNETLAAGRVECEQMREELESRLAGATAALELSEGAIASIRRELTEADAARRAAEQARIDDRREFDTAIRTMQNLGSSLRLRRPGGAAGAGTGRRRRPVQGTVAP